MNYKEELKNKLEELKEIEGFPKGRDEDILEFSNPPYYTACPNPFIEEFIMNNGSKYDPDLDKYKKLPYTSDIDTKKNDALTNAHPNHKKSP